jgi:hypothetical protein
MQKLMIALLYTTKKLLILMKLKVVISDSKFALKKKNQGKGKITEELFKKSGQFLLLF